jgi:polyhydroxyalkanoate synthesis repressor PhaR
MIVIKRYPNRKLYNTHTKQYIKLDQLGEIIRKGDEIQVIDNASGEDLTALTLTQIILEQEKKQSGVLSHSMLTGLIRAGGDRLNAIQRGLLSPFSHWAEADEEIKRRVEKLVSTGEMNQKEGAALIDKLIAAGEQLRVEPVDKEADVFHADKITAFFRQRQLPTQADVKRLSEQLAELEARLESVLNEQTAGKE